jgi:hypothetical protein
MARSPSSRREADGERNAEDGERDVKDGERDGSTPEAVGLAEHVMPTTGALNRFFKMPEPECLREPTFSACAIISTASVG